MSEKKFNLFNPSEEHQMLRETVSAFVAKEVEPQALENDRKERFNLPLFRKCGDLGLLGITVPQQYGGSGMDVVASVIVHEELAASDPGFTLAYLAHSILCTNNLAVNAGESLKSKYLPKLCSGEWVGGMAMSEPAVGTDVLGMQTVAEKKGTSYFLKGRKMWITNGTIDDEGTPGDCILTYAKTGIKNGRPMLSTFVVDPTHKGFSVGQKIRDKTGMRASCTAELVYDNCEIPEANRVGEEGESLVHMMRNLELERVTLAAMSMGIARRALQIMVRYANERSAFGKSLSAFGQIQKYLAESYAEWKAARTFLYDVAGRMRLDQAGNRVESDGVKLFAARVGKDISDRAMQVLGGYGYVGEYVVERLWRDAKLIEIGGGTLEAHQKNISADLSRNSQLIQ